MKKITTILMLLALTCTGAWAEVTQPTVTTDTSNPTYYTIKSFRSGNYATYLGPNTQLGQRNGITYAAIWYFTESGNGVNLVPAVDPTMKMVSTSSATAEGATWYLKENPYRTGNFCVSLSENLSNNCWDDQGSNGTIGYWYPSANDNEGTSWVIEEVNAVDLQTAIDDWNSYPVAISKAAGFTRTDRYTSFIKLGDQIINIPRKNLGTLAYRFISDQKFTGVTGNTAVPAIGFGGVWMHGLLYIDINKDGDFEDDDEFVSHTALDGNALNSNNQNLPEFTLPAEAGTYRMRYEVIWADGASRPQGTSTMLSDGGVIYDVMLEIVSPKGALEAKIAEAEELYTTLSNGAETVAIGYPNSTALQAFRDAIDAAQGVADADQGGYDEAAETLNAAIAAVKSPANTNYTPRTDVYYTITSARGSMIYHPDYVVTGKENISFLFHTGSTKQSGALNVALDKDNANHQWGFILKDGKYYMYNVGKKQFANVTQNGSYQQQNGDKHTWMFSEAPSAVTLDAGEGNWVATPNVRVRATSEVTGKQYAMSISQSYDGPVIAYDAVNDGGIPMTFAVATTTQDEDVTTAIEALLENLQPYRDALQEAIDNANAMNANVGEGLNKYTVTSGMEDFEQALADAQAELAKEDSETSKAALSAALQALETALANMQLTLNMPQVGQFLRIKTAPAWAAQTFSGEQPYLIAENSTVENMTNRAAFSKTAGNDVSSIWCYVEDGGNKYLINYPTGRPVVNNSNFLGFGNDKFMATGATTIAFQPATNGEVGAYGILFASNTRALYTNAGLYTDAAGSTGSGAGYNFTLEEVTELPITLKAVGDKYYATFSAPVDIASITGATMTMNDVEVSSDNKTVTPKEMDATKGLKANNGVLLIAETNDEVVATIGVADESATTTMKSQIASEPAAGHNSAGHYFLGTKSGQIGFYMLKSDGGKTGGFKAYIEKNTSGEAKEGFDLVFGEATGVETIENGTLQNGEMYNLQGQRVNKAQKGVFIQNGKKVVLK